MEVITCHGKRKLPTSASEYFVALYCERRKLKPIIGPAGGMTVWKSLSSSEKEVFKEQFEKWQEENDKKMFRVLENAEPFLKKKATINKENVESGMTGTVLDYDENQSIINLSEKTNDNISNADLELTKQHNAASVIDRDTDELIAQQETQITEPIPPTNIHNAASVIDRDTDELIAKQETQITEPIPPTNIERKKHRTRASYKSLL